MAGNLVANFFDTGEYSRGAAAALLIGGVRGRDPRSCSAAPGRGDDL